MPYEHRLVFGADLLQPTDRRLLDLLRGPSARPPRVLVLLDDGFAAAQPHFSETVTTYLADADLAGPPQLVPGGEACKNDPAELDRLLQLMHDARLCRQSYVLVAGGGSVLDAVGLAATMTHRGVRLVRFPTTTLAQADSGVGVKNGVNRFGKKNFIGCFDPPWAVFNDTRLLTTLDDHTWASGFSEAVKVALVKDADFFDRIEADADRIRAREEQAATAAIEHSARLHVEHIANGGDPFERTVARPLDFGHWSAHRLEALTNFQLAHGHAVAIGLLIDATYSHRTGTLAAAELERIRSTLTRLGFSLQHPALQQHDLLLDGLEEFREHLGGELTISLLKGIGHGFDATQIDLTAMRAVLESVAQEAGNVCT